MLLEFPNRVPSVMAASPGFRCRSRYLSGAIPAGSIHYHVVSQHPYFGVEIKLQIHSGGDRHIGLVAIVIQCPFARFVREGGVVFPGFVG